MSIEEIVQATGGKVLCGNSEAFSGFSIDSRTIGSGELFVALRGERFDAHDFLRDALEKGSGAQGHKIIYAESIRSVVLGICEKGDTMLVNGGKQPEKLIGNKYIGEKE